MKNKSRYLILASSIILISLFFVPIWNIDLKAPQYPEGIGLRIWINQITGLNEFDLANINKLNHYIGMKVIEPDDIPELKIMPYLIIFFILFGVFTAIIKKSFLLKTWILLFTIMLAIGLYDFYSWEYDYGHNLSKDAPIKVPGMVYQPPLIGSKQLLNMETTSMPGIGGYIIGFSFLLSLASFVLDRREKNES